MGEQLYDWKSRQAERLVGQNVRGLTSLKLIKATQFMQDRGVLVACLQEAWRVTPTGIEIEDLGDGYLVLHHGETTKTCKRGRNGVSIVLSPEGRAAWEAGGSKYIHSGNGRMLTVTLAVEGGATLKVGCGYAPGSGKSSAERQAFYDDVAVQTRGGGHRDTSVTFLDANASAGVGVHACDLPANAPRSLGPWGKRHVNSAGQEFREFLQVENLASATTFFRTRGHNYSSWFHPGTGKGHQLDHVLVNDSQIGRVKQAKVYPPIAVESDHFPIYVEVHTGRMQRRQAPPGRVKPANIGALRNKGVQTAYGDAVGEAMLAWREANPGASLEQRAEAWRELTQAAALEVCGPRDRRKEDWFAAAQPVLMERVTGRNKAEVELRNSRKRGGQQRAQAKLKQARKELKREIRNAKTAYIARQCAEATGGQKSYWEAVRALNSGWSRGTARVLQKFLNEDGDMCTTPAENAAAAAMHFTRVYNTTREQPPGAEEAVKSVPQRPMRIDLDSSISRAELETVLQKGKLGKATSNHVPAELLAACRQSEVAMGLLHSLVSDVFEDERTSPAPPLDSPPDPPPP